MPRRVSTYGSEGVNDTPIRRNSEQTLDSLVRLRALSNPAMSYDHKNVDITMLQYYFLPHD